MFVYFLLVFFLYVASQPQLFIAIFHPKLSEKYKKSAIHRFLQEIEDTFLAKEDIEKLVTRFSTTKPTLISKNFSKSGLLQASSFISDIPCPKIVLECWDMYDATQKCIYTYSGEVLVYVRRVLVMGMLRIPLHKVYEDWTINSSYAQFTINTNEYNNVIGKGWLLKLERGDSYLPHPFTR